MTYPERNFKVWYFRGGWRTFTVCYLYAFYTEEQANDEVANIKRQGYYVSGKHLKTDPDMKCADDFDSEESRKEYYYSNGQ